MKNKNNQNKNNWWKHAFGTCYDSVFADLFPEDTNLQVDFLKRNLPLNTKMTILDAACGNGRHSIALAKKGFNVVGVDISESYIKDAQKASKMLLLPPTFILDNLLNFSYHQPFDIVLLLGNAFGYLPHTENLLLLKHLVKLIEFDGFFVIDMSNADKIIPRLKSSDVIEKDISKPDGLWTIKEDYLFNKKTKIKSSHWSVKKNRSIIYEFDSIIRLYTQKELSYILRGLKLTIRKTLGSYKNDPYCASSPRLIIICQKKKPVQKDSQPVRNK